MLDTFMHISPPENMTNNMGQLQISTTDYGSLLPTTNSILNNTPADMVAASTPLNGYNNDTDNVLYWANNFPVTYTHFAVNLFMILFHIMIIALNSCMIAAIRRSKKFEEPGGHCLITLSSAYIWEGSMMIYTGIYGLANMQEKNECLIRFGMTHASLIYMGWANVNLTLDRFLQIEFPFWYKRKIHVKTIWIMNFIAAGFSITYCLSTIIFGWYRPKENRNNVCEYFNILPALHLQIMYIFTFIGFPFLIIAYSRLLYVANRHRKALERLPSTLSRQQRNWKPVKIVFLICAIYIACWAPPGLFGLFITFDPMYPKVTSGYSSLFAALIMVPSISGVINPYIFTLHQEVKKRFLQVIRWRQCCHSIDPLDLNRGRQSPKLTSASESESPNLNNNKDLLNLKPGLTGKLSSLSNTTAISSISGSNTTAITSIDIALEDETFEQKKRKSLSRLGRKLSFKKRLSNTNDISGSTATILQSHSSESDEYAQDNPAEENHAV